MNILNLLIALVVILISMTLHELAHGFIAYKLGDNTAKDEGRLTLNPIKHLDPVTSIALPLILTLSGGPIFGGAKPVPINTRNLKYGAWGMALVAIAGPLTNFILAFIGFLIGHFTGLLYTANYAGYFFVEFVLINLGFGIFNLIPIPPLDGSRVLYALAPDGARRVMEAMEHYGIIIVFVLVFFCSSFFSNIIGTATYNILDFFSWIVGAK